MSAEVERVKTMTGDPAGDRTADVVSSDLLNGTITVTWDDTGQTETVPAHTMQDFTGGWESYYAEVGLAWTGTHPDPEQLQAAMGDWQARGELEAGEEC